MTPEDFEKEMASVVNHHTEYSGIDIEENHYRADMLMCKLLSDLGYDKGIKLFEDMERWYA